MTKPGSEMAVRSGGAFSYSGDPSSSDQDTVRFLMGDTDPNAYFLNDAEVSYLISTARTVGLANPLLQAAAAGAEAIAAELSREVSYSADGVSVSADTLASKFYTVAEKLRTLGLRSDVVGGPDVGGIMFAESFDPTIRPLVFAIGMHDNYLAGQQDFGGQWYANYYWFPEAMPYAMRARSLVSQAAALRGSKAAALPPVGTDPAP